MLKNSKNTVNDSDGRRFAKLASMGEAVFSVQDLATIWGIKNRQTLRVTLARYYKRGLLFRIWKGLYAIKDPKKLDPKLIGLKALNTFAYISCETILYECGLINQRPTAITFVSPLDKKFTILGVNYRSRKLPNNLLYNSNGIVLKNGIRIATKDRAKLDMKFFNPKKYYDANI